MSGEGRVADPVGRVNIAFDQPSLLYDCEWTRIDSHPNLVTSYQIDRGRQYELDRTDTGRATVQIADPDGILDPTNPDGPYYGLIEPLLQISIGRKNPVTDEWFTRFRGFIEEMDYTFDPSQQYNRLQISCVDLFEILAAIEMTPYPDFGDDPALVAPDSPGQIVFANEIMQERVNRVLGSALRTDLDPDRDQWWVAFTGNVEVAISVYSPGENVMTVIQEATDAEFPAVSNAYCEGRTGRLAVHGRNAKLDPAAVAASAGDANWDWHHWHAGDGAAVNAGSGLAHLREFAFNRGLSKIINAAFCSSAYQILAGAQIDAGDDTWARTTDATSQGKYGIRSWSTENLLTLRGWSGGAPIPGWETADELARFTDYYVKNYKDPKNRVTVCGFATMRPEQAHAAATWDLLSQIEIADQINITVASPGGGGFDDEPFFVEGIHETVSPLNPDYDLVRLTLDLSPQAYFEDQTMFS
jgi:hypothetical protein